VGERERKNGREGEEKRERENMKTQNKKKVDEAKSNIDSKEL
jgi:hypothetical protein